MAVRPGDELPPLTVPVTRTLIVAGAIASRDYQDVHHDPELARQKGSPDIFMNILTTNGLVGRYVTDFFGERARLRRVAIRLGAPNYPGDTMVLRGTVVSVADDGEVTVRVTGVNGIGAHVTGTVTASVPEEDAASAADSGDSGDAADSRDSVDSADSADSADSEDLGDLGDSGGREGPEGFLSGGVVG